MFKSLLFYLLFLLLLLLLLFLLLLLLLLLLLSFSFIDGSTTDYWSGDLPNTTFSGGPICSPLYLLQLGPGCTLVTPLTSANYPNNTIIVDFVTWDLYCKYFTDVLQLLPPVSPHWPNTSVVIFASPYVSEVGTYSEPQGNLSMIQDYSVNGRYGLVLIGNTDAYFMNATRNDTACVASVPSGFWVFYNSAGFVVYQVIFCLLYGVLVLLALFHSGVTLKNREFFAFKTLIVLLTGVAALCKPPHLLPVLFFFFFSCGVPLTVSPPSHLLLSSPPRAGD